MKILRKTIVLFLIAWILMITSSVFASESFRYSNEAKLLNQLGLYEGVSSVSFEPDLGTAVNRETGITLLVKIFGKKEQATALSDADTHKILSKFGDAAHISGWARKYIAYAVKMGMMQGDSSTTISPKASIDGRSYATIILRNLGYDIDAGKWVRAAYTLSEKGGLTVTEAKRLNEKALIKDDLVGITYSALNAEGTDMQKLIEKLVSEKVVSYNQAVEAGIDTNETDTLYTAVKKTMLAMKDKIDISGYPESSSSEKVFKIVEQVVADTPEILYFYKSQYWSNGLLEIEYSKDRDTALIHLQKVRQQIDSILAGIIKPGMTDYEKEKAVHDYIINNAQYDSKNLENGTLPPESFSAYGVLISGKGVCESYAEAMKLFMDRLGIENMLISGKAGGQDHLWNLIKIDGDYYHVDVTWDDPVTSDGSDILSYNYFNVTDEEIRKNHTWDAEMYPSATVKKYNYYYYNNMIVNNFSDFYNAIKNTLKSKTSSLTVKAVNFDKQTYDVVSAVNQVAKDNRGIYYGRYVYSTDEETGVIKINFSY